MVRPILTLRRGRWRTPALTFAAWACTVTPSTAALPAIDEIQAIEATLSRHPEIKAFAADFEAAAGRRLQASLRPNPELEVAVDHAADNVAVSLVHPLERGGKRAARLRRAESDLPVLRADFLRLRLDLVAGVRRAFVALLGAQERLRLRQEALELARRLVQTVAEKVKAGAVSPIEATRARVALATASADAVRTQREVGEARLGLASAMGDAEPAFSAAAGSLSADPSVPAWADVQGRIVANPDVTRWAKQEAAREASLEVERSLAVQDLSLKGGVSYDRATGTGLVTVGLVVPLPFYGKNEGSIREAEAVLAKTAEEARAAALRARTELAQRYEALSQAAAEAKLLREEALSGAEQAYQAVSEGYRAGKFRYLDVLDAGTALVDVKVRQAETLTALHLARVDLDRLIGEPSLPADGPASR